MTSPETGWQIFSVCEIVPPKKDFIQQLRSFFTRKSDTSTQKVYSILMIRGQRPAGPWIQDALIISHDQYGRMQILPHYPPFAKNGKRIPVTFSDEMIQKTYRAFAYVRKARQAYRDATELLNATMHYEKR